MMSRVTCPNCNNDLIYACIMGEGIDEYENEKDEIVFHVDCPRCGERVIVVFSFKEVYKK